MGWFTIYDMYRIVVEEYEVSSTGSSGQGYSTTAQFTHTIDYVQYSYVINWRPYDLSSDMKICGFRIYHAAPPGPLLVPMVMKDAP